MQVKKNTMEKKLLSAGQKEFLYFGFEKASIRRIVKDAKTTIGNFYNYFESKDALFGALVEEPYSEFIYLIEHHHDIDFDNTVKASMDINVWRESLNTIFSGLMPKLDDRFILLLNKSDGTSFKNAKQDLINILAQHFNGHISEFAPNYKLENMGDIIALQTVEGILHILEYTNNLEEKQQLIVEQILFIAIGVMGLLNSN